MTIHHSKRLIQFDFFEALTASPPNEKNFSPNSKLCAYLPELSAPQILDMKSRPELLPFFQEAISTSGTATVPAPPPEHSKATHAVQNHHPRTTSTKSRAQGKPFAQQLIDFDSGLLCDPAPGGSSGHASNAEPAAPSIRVDDLERSHGNRDSGVSGFLEYRADSHQIGAAIAGPSDGIRQTSHAATGKASFKRRVSTTLRHAG